MNRSIFLALALTAFASALRAEDPMTVESAGLGRAVLVQGRLGQPLGKVITIEGSAVERDYRRSKGDAVESLFRVDKVEGQTLAEPRVIRLSFFRFLSIRPPADGERRTFRGYEDGGFRGIPNAALKEMKSIPQTQDWYFETDFRVIK